MRFNVKYFGEVSEITGETEEQWELFEVTVSDFRKALITKYPILESRKLSIAVNQKIEESKLFQEGDEIAVLPPFSGG